MTRLLILIVIALFVALVLQPRGEVEAWAWTEGCKLVKKGPELVEFKCEDGATIRMSRTP